MRMGRGLVRMVGKGLRHWQDGLLSSRGFIGRSGADGHVAWP